MIIPKFVKFIGFCTVLALTYIHLQMQIIELAYEGKSKEKELRLIIEENGHMMYTILTLKSANNIGNKLLQDEEGMEFVDPDQIIDLSTNQPVADEDISRADTQRKKTNRLLSFLSFSRRAEARQE